MMDNSNQNNNTRSFTALSAGTMISHYKIIEKIGAGGMGEVYLAEDTELNRKVALKFLPPHLCQDEDCRARFKREAQAAAKLEHPNIVTIHEVSEYQGRPYIVMQYVEGKSLRDIIKEKELPLDKIVDLVIQICEGLGKAHEAGVIHRDIKPSNIIIDADGRPKLLDFGLAAIQSEERLTKTGSLLGTVEYMSPEQVRGEKVDYRSDIFSLGILFFELLTGELPFKSDHGSVAVYSILNEFPSPLARFRSDLSGELQRIIDLSLEKDRESRYQNLTEIITDLRNLKSISDDGSVLTEKVVLSPELDKKSIAIMYFEDFTGDDNIGWLSRGLPHMLITDLEQSRQVNVVSYQRLFDILKLFGKEDVESINIKTATAIAKRARVSKILTGSIFKSGDNIRIDYQLQEVNSGKLLGAGKVLGKDPLVLADELGGDVRTKLDIESSTDEIRKIADVTTNSPEAYRYYLEGVDYHYKWYFPDAEKSFRKALEFDSTFAMAYYHLAVIAYHTDPAEQRNLITKAEEYSDKVSWKEKHYIKAREARILRNYEQAIAELQKIVERYPQEKEAFYWLGANFQYRFQRYEEAVRYYNKAIQIDPFFQEPYNQLAYLYHTIGDFEKSLWAINKYIEIAPDEANPYDTRGEIYAWNGKLDQAIESFIKALEIKPDFDFSWFSLGHMYLFKREYAKAESCYRKPSSSSEKETRSEARLYLAFIPLYQGKFDLALEVLDDGIAADRMEQAEGPANIRKYFQKAYIHKERKDLQSALKEIEKGVEAWHRIEPDHAGYGREYYVQFLAENGEFEKAREVALSLKNDIVEKDSTVMYWYWYAAGCIEMAKGNLELSVYSLEKVAKPKRYHWANYMLAQAYLETGRLGEAIAELENHLYEYDMPSPIWIVKSYYYLGLAYEKSGWNKEAIEKYEEFLEIWKDADPGIAEIEDAGERLARLKKES